MRAATLLRNVPRRLDYDGKVELDHSIVPPLLKLLQEREQAANEKRMPREVLTEHERRLLAGYSGEVGELGDGGLTPSDPRNGLAPHFVRLSEGWRVKTAEEPGLEEAKQYGETTHLQRAADPGTGVKRLNYHNFLSQYDVADDFAVKLWEIAVQMGLKSGRVLLPNCGTGHLLRAKPDAADTVCTLVPNEPIAYEIAASLFPDETIVGGLLERMVLPNGYYDAAIAVTHGAEALAGQYKRSIVMDEAVNSEPDTPPLTEAQHLAFKTLRTIRPGGVAVMVVLEDELFGKGERALRARERLAQFGEMVGAVRVGGSLVRGAPRTSEVQSADEARRAADTKSYVCFALRRRQDMIGREQATAEAERWIPANNEPIIARPGAERKALLAKFGDMAEKTFPTGTLGDRQAPAERQTGIAVRTSTAPVVQPRYEGSYVLINNGLDLGIIREGNVEPFDATAKQAEILRAIVPVRDAVRAVLSAQMTSSDDALLKAEQTKLRAAYDRFSRQFGAISKPKNVVHYHDEPSLPQLLALENYDVGKDRAVPTDFFTERVIGAPTLISHVDTADEALAVSLGRCGYVNQQLMTALTQKTWDQLAESLRGKVFMDPLEGRWVTSDQYLAGNVRAKLDSAKISAAIDPDLFSENVKALEAAQPKPVRTDEIEYQLGTPWIPVKDVTRFLNDLFEVKPASRAKAIQVDYDRIVARWTCRIKEDELSERVRLNWRVGERSIADVVTATLNSRSMSVTIEGEGGVRIADHVETARAHMLQERLKDEFHRWATTDPLRCSRLAALYNDRVNTYVERTYDGSYLSFETMSPLRTLEPHQRNAVARGLEDGAMLAAHALGSGKSAVLVAIAMEARRMGLARKPMITVPRNTINQMAAEILKWYPSANIKVGDGLSIRNKKGIQEFVSQASMANWDIILVSHESQAALQMSAVAQIELLKMEIAENEKERSLTKDTYFLDRVEALKKKLRKLETLRDHQVADGSDQFGFEKIGADMILVDEGHKFKNAPVFTKMNILGVANHGSDRAKDMVMKTAWIRSRNDGKRGVIFATATPVCNAISELYVMMQYVRPDVLRAMGIRHFDAWAATFGRSQTLIEQKPSGDGWQQRDRFIRFTNVPEMVRAFRILADVRTDDDLPEIARQRPKMITELVVSPRDEQDNALRKSLEYRSDSIERQAPIWKKDGAIVLMGDLARYMTDMRLADPAFKEKEQSIVNLLTKNLTRIWRDTEDNLGTQLVFCDVGIGGRFSLYQELREKLVRNGIPRDQIALIHEHDKPNERFKLQTKVNAGRIRILVGSSNKIGIGLNVQTRCVAMHHVDMPLRPDELDQRIGRGQRPGNLNSQVTNYVYATDGMTRRFEILQAKLVPIRQILLAPEKAARRVEAELELTLADIQAELTDNPLVKQKVEIESRLRNLDALRHSHARNAAAMSAEARWLRDKINWVERDSTIATTNGALADVWFLHMRTAKDHQEQAARDAKRKEREDRKNDSQASKAEGSTALNPPADQGNVESKAVAEKKTVPGFHMTIGERSFDDAREAMNEIARCLLEVRATQSTITGDFAGFKLTVKDSWRLTADEALPERAPASLKKTAGLNEGKRGTLGEFRLNNAGGTYSIRITGDASADFAGLVAEMKALTRQKERLEVELADLRGSLAAREDEAAKPFDRESEWVDATQEKARVDSEMLRTQRARDVESDAILMQCLRGRYLASGRPLHPEELKNWSEKEGELVMAAVEPQDDEGIDDAERDLRVRQAVAAVDAGAGQPIELEELLPGA